MNAIDLFCGVGGNSEGARQAGVHVEVAADFWHEAVKWHHANHPECDTREVDLGGETFKGWPQADILIASPPCTGHSRARGKDRDHHGAARDLAWVVVDAVRSIRPRYLMVENVVEMKRWAEYREWVAALKGEGFDLDIRTVNSADHGAPQARNRLIVLGRHVDRTPDSPLTIPTGEFVGKHIPARSILDPNARWSPILPTTGRKRSEATLARIDRARARHGDEFLLAYYGMEPDGRSLDAPLGTVTCKDRHAHVRGDQMRMLRAHECARAMGFPADYRLPAGHVLGLKLVGNAVCPPVARAMMQAILTHAGD